MIIFSKALADQATVWEALRASESCQNLPARFAQVLCPDETGGDVEFDATLQPGLPALLHGCQP